MDSKLIVIVLCVRDAGYSPLLPWPLTISCSYSHQIKPSLTISVHSPVVSGLNKAMRQFLSFTICALWEVNVAMFVTIREKESSLWSFAPVATVPSLIFLWPDFWHLGV